jgi:RND family efflux transporter MFP subunit
MWRPGWRRAAAILGCAAMTSAASCGRKPVENTDNEDLVPVAVEPVVLGTIRGAVSATGQVSILPGAEATLVAPQTARIAEIPVKAGDKVKAGDVLVRFEFPSFRAESVAGAAALRSAELRLKTARTAQERVHALVERGAASRVEADTADREVLEAEAEVAQATAAQRATEASGSNTLLRAPFSGVISERLHIQGDTVRAADDDPILRMFDPTQVQVIATVPIADARRFTVGATARVVAEGRAAAELTRVASRPEAEAGAATVPIELVFDVATDLPPGAQAAVEIDAEQHLNVPLVPVIAVLRDPKNGDAVFVASGDVAHRRRVTTGLVDTERVEILSGVKPGELIITQGLTNVRDGSAITVGK